MIAVFLSVLLCHPGWSQEPLPEGATVIQEKDLNELQSFALKCNDFSEACARRNGLLESYKKEADQLIAHQELRNTQTNAELSAEKRKNHILYPILGTVLGVFLGGYLIKK